MGVHHVDLDVISLHGKAPDIAPQVLCNDHVLVGRKIPITTKPRVNAVTEHVLSLLVSDLEIVAGLQRPEKLVGVIDLPLIDGGGLLQGSKLPEELLVRIGLWETERLARNTCATTVSGGC